MDQRVREKVADLMAEAAHDVFEVAGELDETIDGAEWVELTALLYLCFSDLVRKGENGPTAVKLTLPQAKRLAEAHVKAMHAWNEVEKLINGPLDQNASDALVRYRVNLRYYGNAEGEFWNICPTTNQVKCLLPAWAWPDHPENEQHIRDLKRGSNERR